MQRDTKALRWAGWLFLAGIGTSAVGWLIDTMGYGVEAGIPYMVGIMLLIIVAPITLLMGVIDYVRPPRRIPLPERIERGQSTKVKLPIWARAIAISLGIFAAVLAAGFWGKSNPLPTGPADESFVFSAIQLFFVAGLAGYFVYTFSAGILDEFKSDLLGSGNFLTTDSVVIGSVVLAVLAFIFPPVSITVAKYAGSNLQWTPIWDIPRQYNIDIGVLLVEFVVIGIIGAGAFYLAKKRST
jgi:hypothetical protein